MANAALHTLGRIVQHDRFGIRRVGVLPFDDDAQAAQVEHHVGPLLPGTLNGFGFGINAMLCQQQGKVGVDGFFAVAVGFSHGEP